LVLAALNLPVAMPEDLLDVTNGRRWLPEFESSRGTGPLSFVYFNSYLMNLCQVKIKTVFYLFFIYFVISFSSIFSISIILISLYFIIHSHPFVSSSVDKVSVDDLRISR
jgi:hypothetical protein